MLDEAGVQVVVFEEFTLYVDDAVVAAPAQLALLLAGFGCVEAEEGEFFDNFVGKG